MLGTEIKNEVPDLAERRMERVANTIEIVVNALRVNILADFPDETHRRQQNCSHFVRRRTRRSGTWEGRILARLNRNKKILILVHLY